MATPLTLYLVRHGETLGAEGRCVGQCDLPLAPQARGALMRLGREWPVSRPLRFVSSDLTRARESAAVLTDALGVAAPIMIDPRLREMCFGRWNGRGWTEIEEAEPSAYAEWMANWQDGAAPDGESFGDVITRVAEWAREVQEDSVVVAHAGSIRALLVHALGLPRALAFRLRLDHARVTALRVGDAPELLFLNADRVPNSRRG